MHPGGIECFIFRNHELQVYIIKVRPYISDFKVLKVKIIKVGRV